MGGWGAEQALSPRQCAPWGGLLQRWAPNPTTVSSVASTPRTRPHPHQINEPPLSPTNVPKFTWVKVEEGYKVPSPTPCPLGEPLSTSITSQASPCQAWGAPDPQGCVPKCGARTTLGSCKMWGPGDRGGTRRAAAEGWGRAGSISWASPAAPVQLTGVQCLLFDGVLPALSSAAPMLVAPTRPVPHGGGGIGVSLQLPHGQTHRCSRCQVAGGSCPRWRIGRHGAGRAGLVRAVSYGSRPECDAW